MLWDSFGSQGSDGPSGHLAQATPVPFPLNPPGLMPKAPPTPWFPVLRVPGRGPILDGIGVAGALCEVIPRCRENLANIESEASRWHEQALDKGLPRALESLGSEVARRLFGLEGDSGEAGETATEAKNWGEGLIEKVDEHIQKLKSEHPEGGAPDPNNSNHRDVNHHKGELRGFIKELEKVIRRMPKNREKQRPLREAIERAKDAIEKWGG